MEELVKIGKFRSGAIHKYTGEYLNYEVVTLKADGTIYTDADINGLTIQKNKEGEYLRLSSGTIITPYHFGCIESIDDSIDAIDSTVRLQKFFDFIETNKRYKIDCTGRFVVRDTVVVKGGTIPGTLRLTVPTGTFINGPVVKFQNFQGGEFGNIIIVAGTFSVRRAQTGIATAGVRLAKFGNLAVTGVKLYGLSISSGNDNMVVFQNLSFTWCGSSSGVAKPYSETARNYLANSVNQSSTISIDLDDTEMVSPEYTQNGMFIKIDGHMYCTKSYDTLTKTAIIYPCLATEGQSGEATVYHGGGAFVTGSDSGEVRIRQLNIMTCGIGYYSKALYGGSIQGLVTQSCAFGYVVGDVPNSIGGYGEVLNQPYFENNIYDLVSVSTVGCCTVNNPIALTASKIMTIRPIQTGSSPNDNTGLGRFLINGFSGPASDTLIIPSSLRTGISGGGFATGRLGVTAFDSASRTRTIDLQTSNLIKVVYGENAVYSVIHNCKAGDSIVINAPSGETVNGQSSITFLGSSLPSKFAITAGKWTSTEWRCYITPVDQLESQEDSTAIDVVGLVADFNALLAKLRTNGTMKI